MTGESLTLTGVVSRIIYHNETNGWGVIVLDLFEPVMDDRDSLMDHCTVQGFFPPLLEGTELRVSGTFVTDKKYGRQFKAETVSQVMPIDEEGIERYLASGLIRGAGPALAAAIVACFGKDTLDVIENHPERLREVSGIGYKKANTIAASWKEQRDSLEIMGMLSCIDVSMSVVMKILAQYGASLAVQIIQTNPYQLAYDIRGIGYKKADALAQKIGVRFDDPKRIEAATLFTLTEAADNEGHVFLPRQVLIGRAMELMELEPGHEKLVGGVLDDMIANDEKIVCLDGDAIYLNKLFWAETGTVEHVQRLLSATSWKSFSSVSDLALAHFLNDDQAQAVSIALRKPVSILTGGPGTGKSYTMKALIRELDRLGKRYVLCAPTGRAAKRLSEATDKEAKTIHRTIGYIPGEDGEDEQEQEDGDEKREIDRTDFVIVDESSMVDIGLAHRLLKAIPSGAHILLVGDVDQLPPVCAGNFLRDMIDAGIVPVTRLNQIYRQSAGSNIIVNAHAVNEGEMPTATTGDFYILKAQSGEESADQVVSLVQTRLPAHYHIRPDEIQVLSPMHRGSAGVKALNERLQAALNPPADWKPEVRLFGRLFRHGDRVMQTRNDYKRGVFNGDMGRIVEVDLEGEELMVDVEGRGVIYPFREADQLVLGYASTVHKSQGSEYKCVVMVMLTDQYVMLQRNLLYTGITRARKLFVMLSSEKAIRIAVGNNRIAQRYTGLARKLEAARG